jgi:hypothetical protein
MATLNLVVQSIWTKPNLILVNEADVTVRDKHCLEINLQFVKQVRQNNVVGKLGLVAKLHKLW